MKIKAILLDYCGTIAIDIGSFSRLPKSIVSVLHRRGFNVDEEDVAKAIQTSLDVLPSGLDYSDFARVALTLSKLGLTPKPELVEDLYKVFSETLMLSTELDKDTKDLLAWLKERKLKVGILSNHGSYDAVRNFLGKHDLLKFLDIVVTSHHIGWRKPSKQIFHYALALLNVKSEESVYVGDDILADIFGAKRAGLRAVWKATSSSVTPWIAPDAIITRLSQLKELIEQWV